MTSGNGSTGKGALGILGGMFDPVHAGHIHIARTMAAELSLPQVRMVPCGTPPHRKATTASAEDRCNMLLLAIAPYPELQLDYREITRSGTSHTVDTLISFHDEGYAPLYLLLGSDAFANFCNWHDWRGILQLTNVVVAERPGIQTFVPTELKAALCHNLDELHACKAGHICILSMDAPDISSSIARKSNEAQLPPGIADYIHERKLYLDGNNRNQI